MYALYSIVTTNKIWHKDDNGPYNSRKQRHHQAVQIEMLYYPQVVSEQMGPTATVPTIDNSLVHLGGNNHTILR